MSAEQKTATLSRAALVACAHAVSQEEARYYLGGVCVDIESRSASYVATNGHILLATQVELPKETPDNTLIGRFIIPRITCVDKRVKPNKWVGGEITVEQIGALRLILAGEILANCIDGTFPDWRRIVPKSVNGLVATFNADYLALLKKAGKNYGASKHFGMSHNGEDAALVTWRDSNLFGIIMPMRAETASLPAWFTPTSKVAA